MGLGAGDYKSFALDARTLSKMSLPVIMRGGRHMSKFCDG
jgi:hypothetical protein